MVCSYDDEEIENADCQIDPECGHPKTRAENFRTPSPKAQNVGGGNAEAHPPSIAHAKPARWHGAEQVAASSTPHRSTRCP
jgi:hypothetical protein